MREIKFRGKRFDNNHDDWIYGYLHIIDTYGEGYTGKAIQQQCGTSRPYSVRVNSESVGEYTGLKDKNGKEIYEGDVVYFTVFDHNGSDTQYKGVVKLTECMYQIWNNLESEYYGSDGAFELYWVYRQDDEIEIVGNTYDNPYLIQKAD